MIEKDYIKTLVDKFFEGTTTVAEERLLVDYFRAHEVEPPLQPLRQMFIDLGAVSAPVPLAGRQPLRRRLRLWMAAASVAAAVILSFTLIMRRQNECVAYVYGQRVTDRTEVMKEVKATMATVDEPTADIHNELQQIFQ